MCLPSSSPSTFHHVCSVLPFPWVIWRNAVLAQPFFLFCVDTFGLRLIFEVFNFFQPRFSFCAHWKHPKARMWYGKWSPRAVPSNTLQFPPACSDRRWAPLTLICDQLAVVTLHDWSRSFGSGWIYCLFILKVFSPFAEVERLYLRRQMVINFVGVLTFQCHFDANISPTDLSQLCPRFCAALDKCNIVLGG